MKERRVRAVLSDSGPRLEMGGNLNPVPSANGPRTGSTTVTVADGAMPYRPGEGE